jgi:hypothetical protein
MLTDTVRWQGRIRVFHWRHPASSANCPTCAAAPRGACPKHPARLVSQYAAANLITDLGLNLIRDALEDTSLNGGIRYLAWGTGTGAADHADTALGTETGRRPVTSFADGAAGVKITITYIPPDDGNGVLAELGWFATSAATATAGSGILVARCLYPGGSYTKDNLESIQVQRTDTFA